MNTKLFLIAMMTFSIFSVGLVNAMDSELFAQMNNSAKLLKRLENKQLHQQFIKITAEMDFWRNQWLVKLAECEKQGGVPGSSSFLNYLKGDPCIEAKNAYISFSEEYKKGIDLARKILNSSELEGFGDSLYNNQW